MPRLARARTIKPTSLDIAWAAGIYEGEGCCFVENHIGTGKKRVIGASIDQKDPEILLRLQALFGGNILAYRNGGQHKWRIYAARARGFLMTILKFMSARRRAQIVTKFALDGKREGA